MALGTNERITGVKFVAMDSQSNTVLAGPMITNENGEIDFGIDALPNIYYLAFSGLQWQVHEQATFSKAEKNSPLPLWAAPRRIIMRPTPALDGLPRIAGRVVDAVTGEPLDHVFIGNTILPTAYENRFDPADDVTATDGIFVSHEISVGANPVTGNLTQIDVLVISRAGYRPRTWVYEWANGDNNLDVTGAEIALTPLDENENGVLTGTVHRQGVPAIGVQVGIGGIQPNKSGVGLPGQVAVTDTEGRYTFSGLAAGRYTVHPGFRLHDGVYLPNQIGWTSVDVANDQTREAPELVVLWEIDPALGADPTFSRAQGFLELTWSRVANATSYTLSINGTEFAEVADSYFRGPITGEMPDGWHFWRVEARSETGDVLGMMQREAWFQLVE